MQHDMDKISYPCALARESSNMLNFRVPASRPPVDMAVSAVTAPVIYCESLPIHRTCVLTGSSSRDQRPSKTTRVVTNQGLMNVGSNRVHAVHDIAVRVNNRTDGSGV
jgi:hypothetical protein